MRPFLAFILATLFLIPAYGAGLQANFDYCKFYSPTQGNYIETYVTINGNTLQYKQTENGYFQATINFKISFSKPGASDIVKNYEIESPLVPDTSVHLTNFIAQDRILLDSGTYTMTIELADKANPEDNFTAQQNIAVDVIENNLAISDIQLFDSLFKADEFTRYPKGGYDLIPYQSTFYPEEQNELGFYFEVYNSDELLGEKEDYLITYYIENYEAKKVEGSFKSFKKMKTSSVNAAAYSFAIEELASGNYNLVVEIRNKKNELLIDKKLFFQRSNPKFLSETDGNLTGKFVEKYTDRDTLEEFIRTMQPIADGSEMSFIEKRLEMSKLEDLQVFMYNFWLRRDAIDPEGAWIDYHEEVNKVNKNYSTRIMKGYMTPRGFRYLKYGPPNLLDRNYNEPGTYPYEIWTYYQINGQANRRFVFWSTKAVTNHFELLHSDMIGEIQNPQWRYKLTIGNTATPTNREIISPTPNTFGSNPQINFRDK